VQTLCASLCALTRKWLLLQSGTYGFEPCTAHHFGRLISLDKAVFFISKLLIP